ncbi:MAG: helix-turn-helix domain-containing protein [Lacrimispora sp.]|uniref:helix-turn-helix domain-containing protein n=1 Tax=Lacrimispora sp. TaxID=2719234 RepID=UPI0039E2F398
MVENRFSAEPRLGTKEVSKHLGVTGRKRISSEKIPCHRVGKLWKFKASEVDQWVQSGDAAEVDKD